MREHQARTEPVRQERETVLILSAGGSCRPGRGARACYLIEAIAKEEKIDFTQKEVEDKAKEMAENYGITPEELIEAYGSIEVVKYDMKMHRALEILKESNK